MRLLRLHIGVHAAVVVVVKVVEGKAIPLQALERPFGFQEVEALRISRQSAHEGGKVVSPTHRPSLPSGRIPGTHFC